MTPALKNISDCMNAVIEAGAPPQCIVMGQMVLGQLAAEYMDTFGRSIDPLVPLLGLTLHIDEKMPMDEFHVVPANLCPFCSGPFAHVVHYKQAIEEAFSK